MPSLGDSAVTWPRESAPVFSVAESPISAVPQLEKEAAVVTRIATANSYNKSNKSNSNS